MPEWPFLEELSLETGQTALLDALYAADLEVSCVGAKAMQISKLFVLTTFQNEASQNAQTRNHTVIITVHDVLVCIEVWQLSSVCLITNARCNWRTVALLAHVLLESLPVVTTSLWKHNTHRNLHMCVYVRGPYQIVHGISGRHAMCTTYCKSRHVRCIFASFDHWTT